MFVAVSHKHQESPEALHGFNVWMVASLVWWCLSMRPINSFGAPSSTLTCQQPVAQEDGKLKGDDLGRCALEDDVGHVNDFEI